MAPRIGAIVRGKPSSNLGEISGGARDPEDAQFRPLTAATCVRGDAVCGLELLLRVAAFAGWAFVAFLLTVEVCVRAVVLLAELACGALVMRLASASCVFGCGSLRPDAPGIVND